MNERLLQYIWQQQHFNTSSLTTTTGEVLEILHPGTWNQHQGPDFSQARIRMGQIQMAGTIELHLRHSDWYRHHHHTDKNYGNVILHVVWEDDLPGQIPVWPVLELSGRVPGALLQTYQHWMQESGFIPCGKQLQQVPELTFISWKDRMLMERLSRKGSGLLQQRHVPDGQWEEIYWRLMARYFGGKVNAEAFEDMAQRTPLKVIERHQYSIHQLEALLFGQCGLLKNPFEDPYPEMLRKEYLVLQKKHHLKPAMIPVHFLRMRPGNFPSIRLAQLAALLHKETSLFNQLIHCREQTEYRELLAITANDYWHHHYRFAELSSYLPKHTGQQFIDTLLINVACPALYSYGEESRQPALSDKALQWLSALPAESNQVINGFERIGQRPVSAADTQALLHLKSCYCDTRKCLECAVGIHLLKEPAGNLSSNNLPAFNGIQ